MSLSECSFSLIADWSSIKEHQHSLHWTYTTTLHKSIIIYNRVNRHACALSGVLNFVDMNVLITIRPTSSRFVPFTCAATHVHVWELLLWLLWSVHTYYISSHCIHFVTIATTLITCIQIYYYNVILFCIKNDTHKRCVFERTLASYVWLVIKWGLPSSSGRSVSMSQPVSVTNRVCSNWAERRPSWGREGGRGTANRRHWLP